ncbi:MAG: L,D-transpeptidase [Kiritimatiellia bacterium]
MNAPDPSFLAVPGRAQKAGWPERAPLIVVSVAAQKAGLLLPGGRWAGPWPVSTARAGTGDEPGSHRTPTGLHRVAERIGAGAPPGAEFVSRAPTGRVLTAGEMSAADDDLILTRILWLEACNPASTRTPLAGTSYIHGTNRESDLGSPASHGCIRMSNRDVIALSALLPGGTDAWCWIE